jgi:hypothetical protein
MVEVEVECKRTDMIDVFHHFILPPPVIHEATRHAVIFDDFDGKMSAGLPAYTMIDVSGCSCPQAEYRQYSNMVSSCPVVDLLADHLEVGVDLDPVLALPVYVSRDKISWITHSVWTK